MCSRCAPVPGNVIIVDCPVAMALAAGQPNPPPKLSPPLPAASHSYHMMTGTYAGRDPRDLIEEAIAWWEQQIESIEQDAAGR